MTSVIGIQVINIQVITIQVITVHVLSIQVISRLTVTGDICQIFTIRRKLKNVFIFIVRLHCVGSNS